MTRAEWHRRASGLVLFWLAASVIPPLIHRSVPAAGWLMVHVLLLGAATNALFVWSQHFTYALLRLPEPPGHAAETVRLGLANAGIVTVMAAMVSDHLTLIGAGAALVAIAAGWHAITLIRLMRRALPSRFGVTVRYYVAASGLLLVAVGLGTAMALADADETEGLLLAHATAALLGWLGLGILGTLVTLWPTMLHSRIIDGSERAARRALPALVAGVLVAAGGLTLGLRLVGLIGLAAYALGAGWMLRPVVLAARQRGPRTFATLSTACGVAWLGIALSLAMARLALTPDPSEATRGAGAISAAAVVGIAQVLLGALTHLTPVVAGGGPGVLRVRMARAERWGVSRLTVTNAGLLLCLLPVPSAVRVTASVTVLGALALSACAVASSLFVGKRSASGPARAERVTRGLVAGLAVVILAAIVGVAADPGALGLAAAGRPADAGVPATGRTTTVDVHVEGMRFSPATVTVPTGDRLVLLLHNTGDDTHDLVLDTGQRTPRLRPGESATLDVGVVGRSVGGWCSVAGHRQMGMVLAIEVQGQPVRTESDHSSDAGASMPGMSAMPDPMADPPPGFSARDAALPPASQTRVHRVRLVAREVTIEVAPGVTQTRWTYNGTAPGPVLRGHVGDTFIVTLVNDGSIGHSIDFHAGALAPDRPMRTIQPGESLVYRFTAKRAGIWMYHCSTMPMSMHIANGMFGAVIIDPPRLAQVDHEFVLVQSEGYLGESGGTSDPAKIAAGDAALMMFNGYAMQYRYAPLGVGAGERVRVWVLDAGPNRYSAFHVVGAQFDTVYREGGYELRPGSGGSQVLGLFPAQGGFVEFTLPQAGHYSFLTHAMSDAERGASGVMVAR